MAQQTVTGVQAASSDHRVSLGPRWSLWRLAGLRSAGMPFGWLAAFASPNSGPAGGAQAAETRARARSAAAVRSVLSEPAFLEALTWQNPALVRNWVGRYVAALGDRTDAPLARRDQREALIAFLAQRYCAKNETIGFFGPVSWARLDDRVDGLRIEGSWALRRRSVYVEVWAVDAVAAVWAREPRLLMHLTARMHPAAGLVGRRLYRPRRPPVVVEGPAASVLEALAAPVPVRRVLERVEAATAGRVGQQAALEELLHLRDAGVVLLEFPTPIDHDPVGHLRRTVTAIDDQAVREDLLGRLDSLESAVQEVAAAAGDPVALLDALGGLDERFLALTGRGGRRDKPAGRDGRTLVYEDCRRDLDVTVGSGLIDALRRPLTLVLDTARWFVAEVGDEVEAELTRRMEQRSRGGRTLNAPLALSDLVLLASDILTGQPGTAVHRVVEDFRARWAELLATGTGTPLRLRSAAVAPLAQALFPPRPVRWRAARHHSPDLLLCAPGPGRERPLWVLGELHLTLNTLENRAFETQADHPEELIAAAAADTPGGRVVPLYPKASPDVTSRTYPPPALDVVDHYVYWSPARDDGHPAGVAALPGAALQVAKANGRLIVRPASGGWEADVLEFLGEFLTALVVNRFEIRDPAPHAPRVILDDFVLCRESWRLPVGDAPLPSPERASYEHQELRTWLRERGVPRHCFAKTPGERKPYHVDLEAPLSLRNLARTLRRAMDTSDEAYVHITEMLPGPDDLWLSDPRGDRFTAEFRAVAVDELEPDTTPVLRHPPESAASS